jgi:predicted O-methyltransferase YrrM
MGLRSARSLVKKVPGVPQAYFLLQAVKHSQNPFLKSAPPGHFYSPIPDLDYTREHRGDLWSEIKRSLPGIELAEEKQIGLVRQLAAYYGEVPFTEHKQDGARYYFENPYLGHGSSIILYSMMRHFRPKRIVEVGSGFSSAAMLDVNDRFFDGGIRFTFVEPYPERLLSLLSDRDKHRHRICKDIVQNVPPDMFAELESNDILFIDSSHVAKVGSDVGYLLGEVLPLLKKGVIVHIHDIYWPFEYPEDWVLSGKAWNEAYMVKAFLQFNNCFEIILFNSYLATHQQKLMQECLPLFLPDGGSGLWLRKTC